MAGISLRNVHKVYTTSKGPTHALRGVDLDCHDNEILAVLGPSGSGKSSLMRMIAGLETISAGEISIAGKPVNHLPPQKRNVSLAFENYALYPAMTVRQNIEFPLKNIGRLSAQKRNERINDIVDYLDLRDVLNRKPAELSGGHRQMVSLGRALVKPADLHILDEPLSHLDLRFRNEVVAKLKTLQRERGLTMILITHDQEEALEMADRVAVINDGLLQQVGSPEDIVRRPSNIFVADFVGEPPMNFIPGRFVEGSASDLITENGMLISLPVGSAIARNTRDLLVGVRPSNLHVVNGETEKCVFEEQAQLLFEEQLGEISVLNVAVFGHHLRVVQRRREATQLVGDQIRISYDPKDLHIFDRESGSRVDFHDQKSPQDRNGRGGETPARVAGKSNG